MNGRSLMSRFGKGAVPGGFGDFIRIGGAVGALELALLLFFLLALLLELLLAFLKLIVALQSGLLGAIGRRVTEAIAVAPWGNCLREDRWSDIIRQCGQASSSLESRRFGATIR